MVVGKELMNDEITTSKGSSDPTNEASSTANSARQKLLNKDAEKRKKRAQQFGAISSTNAQPIELYEAVVAPSPTEVATSPAPKIGFKKDEKTNSSPSPVAAVSTVNPTAPSTEVKDAKVSNPPLVQKKKEESSSSSSSSSLATPQQIPDVAAAAAQVGKLKNAEVTEAFAEVKPMVTENTKEPRNEKIKKDNVKTAVDEIIFNPAPKGKKIHCKIIRQRNGLDSLFPKYELYLESSLDQEPIEFLLYARKRKKSKNSNYFISKSYLGHESNKDKEGYVGKLRSNFIGTSFVVFDDGFNPSKGPTGSSGNLSASPRQELASVLYETNILGFKGPRKMTVILPSMDDSGKRKVCDEMQVKYKKGDTSEILVLGNKSPQWNEETQSYVLNFNGRVTMASVKNFQIVNANDLDYIILQFGKTGKDSFTMDYQYPLSAIQAFGIVLSSFDAKLACE